MRDFAARSCLLPTKFPSEASGRWIQMLAVGPYEPSAQPTSQAIVSSHNDMRKFQCSSQPTLSPTQSSWITALDIRYS